MHLLHVPHETHIPFNGAVLSGHDPIQVLLNKYPETQLVQVVPNNEHVKQGF